MADTRTVKELFGFLEQLVKDGHGDAIIMFDTEARTFEYHMAKIGRAYHDKEMSESVGYDFVSLHEFEERYQKEPLPT
jgi:hypothetical protein